MKLNRKVLISLICILSILCSIGAAAYFKLLYQPDKTLNEAPTKYAVVSATAKDKYGNSYAAVVDAKGVTYAALQDTNGDIWQVNFEADGSLGKPIACLNGVAGMDSIFTTVPGATNPHTTRPVVQTNNNADYTGEDQNAGSTTKPSKKPSDENKKKELNVIRYKKMLADGNYYIEFTTNDPGLGTEPIVSACKDGNIAFNTVIEGMSAKVIYRADKDKSYAVVDDYKMYAALPKSMMGEDVSVADMNLMATYFNKEFTSDSVHVSKAKINGRNLVKETCVSKKGTRYDYYFDKGNFVRIDVTDTEGKSTIMYISKISTEVPDELFIIPEGYRYLNLSWL